MMRNIVLALVALALSSLACTQSSGFATFTPTAPASTATVRPPTSTPPLATVPATEQTARVVRPVVQVHEEADKDSPVIDWLTEGKSVTVLECSMDWCKIQFLEQTGYIWRGCLSGNEDRRCEAQ